MSNEGRLRDRLQSALDEGHCAEFGAAPDLGAEHDVYLAADPAADDVIPAAVIVELLTREPPVSKRPQVLRIRGAAIVGELHMEYATARIPMVLDQCRLDTVNLEQATVIDMWFNGCRISELLGSQVRAAYNLALSGSRADGRVYLVGAHLGGHLILSGSRLACPTGPALSADDAIVEGRIDCGPLESEDDSPWRPFEADSFVSLTRVKASYLTMAGAHVNGQSGVAIQASGMDIADDVLMSASVVGDDGTGHSEDERAPLRFEAGGTVNLIGAKIGGDLVLRGAHLKTGDDGVALRGQRMRIANWLVCGDAKSRGGKAAFETDGTIDLLASQIHRLEFTGATFGGPLDLRSVRTGRLEDLGTTWPDKLSLDGLVYEEMPGLTLADSVATRLAWIRGAAAMGGYRPRVYNQLATVYRNAGLDDAAREVLLDKQRERAKARVRPRETTDPNEMLRKIGHQAADQARPRATGVRAKVVNGGRRIWEWFLDSTIGYGYKPVNILRWLVAAWLVASVSFSLLEADYIDPAKETGKQPDFIPWLYSLDLLLPVVSLGQRSLFLTDGLATYLAAGFVVLGWFCGAVLIAGLSGLFKRD